MQTKSPVASLPALASLENGQHTSAEDVLLPLLVQLTIIILVARLFANLFRKIRQPGVVGEIAAGLALGPSFLGHFFPEFSAALFHPAVNGMTPEASRELYDWVLTILSQLGLVFFLFLIGLEFDFGHLRWHGQSAVAISVSGVALPFALGLGLGVAMLPYIGEIKSEIGFIFFLATALASTAIPVLGRILTELDITRTRLGAIAIAAAAVNDAAGWILLAAVAAVVRASFNLGQTLLMACESLGFALFMIFVARLLLRGWVRRGLGPANGEIGVNSLAMLIAILFACAIATSLIGIFALLGAFLLVECFSEQEVFRQAVTQQMRDFTSAFFLPIFFTFTGLRTDGARWNRGSCGCSGDWCWRRPLQPNLAVAGWQLTSAVCPHAKPPAWVR
jgi:Kef-type K+ transport system membrane component KefB